MTAVGFDDEIVPESRTVVVWVGMRNLYRLTVGWARVHQFGYAALCLPASRT